MKRACKGPSSPSGDSEECPMLGNIDLPANFNLELMGCLTVAWLASCSGQRFKGLMCLKFGAFFL